MPITYNGIGTRYYGRSNVQTRAGVCRNCGRNVELASYDTRLWFVVVFIPVIPLGRKRILDYCPSCRRHYVLNLEKWETARQLEISGALEKFRAQPGPEAAIAVHQQMIGFHQIDEAGDFQKLMLAQFPDNAKMLAYLGAAHERLGNRTEAADFYARALALRNDLPEARVGVALGLIRGLRLDGARQLLDFLEKPGAAQLYSLAPLETLARAYQAAGRHQETLDLAGKILEGLPRVAEHSGFRKWVRTSEKALGRRNTILPKQKFSLKRLFQRGGRGPRVTARSLLVVGAVIALILLGLVITNEYTRRHRQLYLVNAYDTPATVEIAGVGTVRQFKGVRTLDLSEGHYHAIISGPVRQELDFDVRDSYLSRWGGHPLWLINVGGQALLEEIVAAYSQNPQPPSIFFLYGNTFEHINNVTHPFTPLPSSVEIQSGGSRELIGLDLFKGEASDVFEFFAGKRRSDEALNFAETWLRGHPDDDLLLDIYASTASHDGQQDRLDAFLRAGMTNRPVRINWHRTYQYVHDHPAGRDALVREYDALLQADPANSALLYLRGRLEGDLASAQDYFERSQKADPQNPYPGLALGYDHLIFADWAGAKPLLEQALKLKSHDSGLEGFLFLARLGLGEAPALEAEAREKLRRNPVSYQDEFNLTEALAAQDRPDDVKTAMNAFTAACRSRYGSRAKSLEQAAEYHAYYAVGDFAQLKTFTSADSSSAGYTIRAAALIEQGQPAQAMAELPADTSDADRLLFLLAAAVSGQQAADKATAAQSLARALEILRAGDEDSVKAASLLTRGTPPTPDEARDVLLPLQIKPIYLLVLAQQYPQSRSELGSLARALNVEHQFPYHLVRRTTAGL